MLDNNSQEQIDNFKEVLYEMGRAIIKVSEPIIDSLKKIFDGLEPYQKFEILHPRKKPRGSIRREKRKRRGMI